MFLSKLVLNLKNNLVLRELNDCYLMHQRILTGFSRGINSSDIDFFDSVKDIKNNQPSRPKGLRASLDVLYRIEKKGIILVQSKIKPSWGILPKNYLLKDKDRGFQVNNLSRMLEVLESGTSVLFRLKAHPTFYSKSRVPHKKYRRALIKLDDVHEWINHKVKRYGFKIGQVTVRHQANVRGKKSKNRLDFISFQFEGKLTITDIGRFKVGLQEGIGRGKSFGFGLLSIAPEN